MNDDETRQPRMPEDYMTMIVAALGVNTPQDALQWVEDRKQAWTPLVFANKEGQIGYARGIRVGAWLSITQAINKMIEDTAV